MKEKIRDTAFQGRLDRIYKGKVQDGGKWMRQDIMEKNFPESPYRKGSRKAWIQKTLLRHLLLKFSKYKPKKTKLKALCKNKNNLAKE